MGLIRILKRTWWKYREKIKQNKYSWIKIDSFFEKIAIGMLPEGYILHLKRISLFDYCLENGGEIIDIDGLEVVSSPSYCKSLEEFESFSPEYKIYRFDGNKLFRIENVCVVGDTDLIYNEQYCMDNRLLWNRNRVVNERYYLVEVDSNETDILVAQGKQYLHVPKAISLIKGQSTNYYHFTIEAISRLRYIDNYERFDDYPILINQEVFEDDRNRELIEAYNIKNRRIIPVPASKSVLVDDLLIPPIHCWFVNQGGSECAVLHNALGSITREIPKRLVATKMYPPKIYVTRGNNERMINESECAEFFSRFGFEVINPDKMSWTEEVLYFYNAKIIAGVSGAAFTNLLYCNENAICIMICPYEHQSAGAGQFVGVCDIGRVIHIDPKIVKHGGSLNSTKFEVDLEKVKKVIESII